MQYAKNLGFEGIELCLSLNGNFSMASSEDEIYMVRNTAEKIDIAISSICSGLFFQYSLTSANKDIRQGAMEVIKKELDFAAILGADSILAVPGIVGTDFRPEEVVPDITYLVYYAGSEIVPYDIAYDRSLAAFKELAVYAEQKQVRIGIENIWGKFLISPLEMREFVDKIGSDYVRCYFDVGNSALFGYPEHWIRILGKRIINIHLKDFRRGTTMLTGFCDLLSGDVDWIAVKKALDEIDYEGWTNAEMTPVYKTYPEQTAENASRAIDRILGRRK
jgi:hexulose-6-phosphate isomerase